MNSYFDSAESGEQWRDWELGWGGNCWDREKPPADLLLQQIWANQRLLREKLVCVSGERVHLLHPGFWNRGAGPDFQGAIIRFDGDGVVTGDVEIDVVESGWRNHKHHINPAYERVILHVVYESSEGRNPIQSRPLNPRLMELKPFLDSPIYSLESWMDNGVHHFQSIEGKCCVPLSTLGQETISKLVLHAALMRLRRKAHRFLARARNAGWYQALWEGLFAGLGYRYNAWPMIRIAESIPQILADLPIQESRIKIIQARLFGMAGFLHPLSTSTPREWKEYWGELWSQWWRDRSQLEPFILPPNMWCWQNMRPTNHPQRRLALAASWLSNPGFLSQLTSWVKASVHNDIHKQTPWESLVQFLDPGPMSFWNKHWTLEGPEISHGDTGLIGAPRGSDLAMNIILPWYWAKVYAESDSKARRLVEDLYVAWPPSQSNQILNHVKRRLFGHREFSLPARAFAQQGLLQIAADFCQRSDALCQNCRFPDVVTELTLKTGMEPEKDG